MLWQHITYLCALFLVQGGKWTAVHLPPCTRKNVHKYMVSTLHNLILTFHIFTIMVLTINIILITPILIILFIIIYRYAATTIL